MMGPENLETLLILISLCAFNALKINSFSNLNPMDF